MLKSDLTKGIVGQYLSRFIDNRTSNIEQLALITGIPSKYTLYVQLFEAAPDEGNPRTCHMHLQIGDDQYGCVVARGLGAFDNAVPCYLLQFWASFFIQNISISYNLIPESEVPEGVCSEFICQYKYTESFFNKIKMAIYNKELNSKLRLLDLNTLGLERWYVEHDKVYKEFNVGQYVNCYAPCVHEFDLAGSIYGIGRPLSYNRNRG